MSNILMVPIYLDALFLENDKLIANAMADFTRLPYFNGERDVNSNIANISEEVVNQPFQNKNFLLKAGIHLHWALPDALTKTMTIQPGVTDKQTNPFPPVPNRWLIERTGDGLLPQKWIVESDYLYPCETDESKIGSVNIPSPVSTGIKNHPFRYLGRKMTFENWKEQRSQPVDRFKPLTAIGYGEPTFAAFYPNCHSVFGFYDGDDKIRQYSKPCKGLKYTVLGWYDQTETDYLKTFIQDVKNNQSNSKQADLLAAIQKELKWTTTVPDNQHFPKEIQMLCYAQINFNPNSNIDNSDNNSNTKIAIANTGTEALAAYLSHEITAEDKSCSLLELAKHRSLIEDQLEALHFLADLEHRQIDIGPKFEEARHNKGFNAVPAGTIWTIHEETEKNKENIPKQKTLSKDIAHLLNELNHQQKEYDRALDEIESLQHRLFSDWYKYMLCAYPPDDSRDDYPNIDEVKHYIEVEGIAPLKDKITKTGELKFTVDKQNTLLKAEASSSDSIAGEVAEKINNLITQINNKSKSFNSLNNRYILKPIAAPCYWEPKEPVILIAGDAAKYTQRHGSDGRLNDNLLECHIYCDSGNKEQNKTLSDFIANDTEKIVSEINNIKNSEKDSIAFSSWTQQPWNPFLLEWKVEIHPVEYQNNLHPETRDYNQDFIQSNYILEQNATDLTIKTKKVVRAANIYSGTCIVTTHASIKLNRELKPYSKNEFLAEFDKKSDPVSSVNRFISWCLPRLNVKEGYIKYKISSGKSLSVNNCNEAWLQQNASDFLSWFKVDMPAVILEQFYKDQSIKKEDQNDTYIQKDISQIVHWCQVELPKLYQLVVLGSAEEKLSRLNCFSQVLGGFNAGLLMHKQTMQLAIDEPIGFDNYKAFTERVRESVGDRVKVAPLPFNDFNPIRTGVMRILRLRLIDTFGQVKDLDPQGLIVSSKMLPPPEYKPIDTNDWIFLPPRLVQPTRLNFRWLSADQKLSADGKKQESNSHPATTPICGWLLPNNLDNSLMVYDGSGNALGSINQKARWMPAPGINPPFQVDNDNINNQYLQKLVQQLTVRDEDITEKASKESFITSFISAIDKALENIEPENFAQHQDLALLMGNPIAVVRASLSLELQGLPAIHHGWKEFRQDLQRKERDTDGVTSVKFPIRIGEYQQLNDGVIGYWQENQDGSLGDTFYAPQSGNVDNEQIVTHSSKDTALESQEREVKKKPDKLIFLQAKADALQTFTLLIDPRGKVHATCGILPTKAIDLPHSYYSEALKNIEITFLTAPILTDAGKIRLPLPDEPGYAWSWLQKECYTKERYTKERYTWKEVSTVGILGKEDIEGTYIGTVNPGARFGDRQEIREGWLKLKQI